MDGDERDDDPDRDAILSRRNRMIGIALAGLTSVAGCGDQEPEPQVCLSPVVVDEQEPAEPELPPADPDVSPHPCLSVAAPDEPDEPEPPPDPGVSPHPCLSVAAPDEPDEPEPPPEKPGDDLG